MQATNRRGFLKGAAFLGAASVAPGVIATANERPALRVAIMSDIQGHPYPEDAGMRNLERALDVLAPLKPDVVVNDGDINDSGNDMDAVAYYKVRCDARLGRIPHVACMGNHEVGFITNENQPYRTSAVCLREFNAVFGYAPDGHESVGLMLLEVFRNRLVFRRFSARDRREIEPDSPWTVPWPHDPMSAPYSHERRRAVESAPQFGGDAEPTLWYDFGYVYLMFNAVKKPQSAFGYRIELSSENGDAKSYFQLSDYYRIPEHRQDRVVFRAPPGALTPGGRYCCRIFPVGFVGAEGYPSALRFTIRPTYRFRTDKPAFVQE